jgi:transposase
VAAARGAPGIRGACPRRSSGARFRVDYTLAGVDLLLHRIGWSVQVPARQAAERDEARITAWREGTRPAVKERQWSWAPG